MDLSPTESPTKIQTEIVRWNLGFSSIWFRNKLLKVEKYQFKIDDGEVFIETEGQVDDDFSFPAEKVQEDIQVRIKYKGFEEWTRWISFEQPVSADIIDKP